MKPEFDKVICDEKGNGVQGLWVPQDNKPNQKITHVCLFGEGIRSVMRMKVFEPKEMSSDSEFVKENKTPGLADLKPSDAIYCLGQRYQPVVWLLQYPSADKIILDATRPSASQMDPCESVKLIFSDKARTYIRKK